MMTGKVLVLEDDPGISRLQHRHLERAGYEVETASATGEAREKLRVGGFDLLVLDYQLEGPQNGIDFYRQLQREGSDIPAILVTGFSDETRLVEAMRAGVRDFILKTPNFIELVAPTVDRVMRQVRGERQLIAAEAASRAKDDFLALLSHELRTPLTPVLALVSSLRNDARLPQDVREDVATICRNIELEARLIDDLLDVTRIVRGKLELRMENVDIRPIIEHAIKTCCTHEAAEKLIKCDQEFADGVHVAHVDPARLTQVFWNLLKNAIKFTPPGGRIHVRTRHEIPESRPWLIIEVSDTGIGIEPAILPRIFGAFEQGDRSVTQQFGGLGLGLAISKAIMDLHGGSIAASSAGRGKGATFMVRLPLVPAGEAAEKRGAADSSPGARTLTAYDRAHLLLVEDHLDTAHVMARMLRRAGFQVTVATSVAQALAETEAARKTADESGRVHPIRFVVSDLGLPDGSGAELMRTLRERHGLRGIALSGYGMEDDVQNAVEAGFVKHLTKPVDFETLITTLREALARS